MKVNPMIVIAVVVLLVVSVSSILYFGKSNGSDVTNNGGVEIDGPAPGEGESGEESESEEAGDEEAVVTNGATIPVVTKTAEMKDPITLATIATHSKAEDCWMAIEGKVYDMTPYIQKQIHPGGAAILFGCGKDSTVIFNLRPKDNKPHSTKARSYLTNYYIGELAK